MLHTSNSSFCDSSCKLPSVTPWGILNALLTVEISPLPKACPSNCLICTLKPSSEMLDNVLADLILASQLKKDGRDASDEDIDEDEGAS